MKHPSPKIRKTLLKLLDAAFPYAQPEDQLLTELNLLLHPPLGPKDFAAEIAWMKENDWIKALPGDFGDTKARWLITAAGQGQNTR